MERIKIKTHNLSIEDNQIQSFKASFGHALKTAPSDSTLCCCILRENETYTLNISVHSATGHFPIHVQAMSIADLISQTTERMAAQFKQWHEDPKKYGETHQLGESPCRHKDGTTLTCPLKL